MAVLALILFGRSWPARGIIDGHWTRAAAPETGWRAWGRDRTATFLRDEVALRLSEALGAPMTDWPPAELRTRIGRKYGARTAEAAASLWARLRRASPWLARRQLARLHAFGARAL